ncbi:MAG: hypothetical protein ABIH92_03850 [Nanoarchaeota archaeon]
MKNKKGVVIGKAITSVITIIVVFVIMGAFTILAAGISVLKKPPIQDPVSTVGSAGGSLLFKEVEVQLGDQIEKMFVYDLITLWLKGEVENDKFYAYLSPSLNEENNCLVVQQVQPEWNEKPTGILGFRVWEYKNGEIKEDTYSTRLDLSDLDEFNPDLYNHLFNNADSRTFTINNEEIEILYYLGRCPI